MNQPVAANQKELDKKEVQRQSVEQKVVSKPVLYNLNEAPVIPQE